ncbi:IS5 family transposase [Oligoflexus tunisiensis]|uniref:IS5 family transposase n=1 Tax=Oligoflexus tunisiensis TaxID=708132 RepID=UPI00114CAA83|nr:IS5 family transposase [Oligoflexus tunisiensis]
MPEQLWIQMESLLPARPRTTRKGGRPRLQKLKPVADAIFYKMRTGCQWNAIPRVFGASSTIHDYFQEWVELGIFERIWKLALTEYEELRGTSWKHQLLDTATVKAPLGGEKTGRNPTDRGKLGSKRSILVDGRGVPLSCEIAGANIHDAQIVQKTLKKRKYRRPRNRLRKRMHIHSWANQFRGLKVRWEKKACNYEALLHISFALTALRIAGVFG